MSGTRRSPRSAAPAAALEGRAQLLRRSSLFAELPDEALTSLADRFTERSYRRGDILWRAGDQGDELLVVVSGQLDVWGAAADGSEQLVGRVGPGECAGEMALVLDERRSATVTCGRAAHVLALQKPDFRDIARNDARILASLTELLSRRAMMLAQRRPVARLATVVGVVADPGVPGASLVAAAIAQLGGEILGAEALLVRVGREGAALVELAGGAGTGPDIHRRAGLPPTVLAAAPPDLTADGLAAAIDGLLARLGDRFRLVVVDLPPLPHGGVVTAGAACEQVVHVTAALVAPAEGRARVLQVLNLHGASQVAPAINGCEPFVLPDDAAFEGRGHDEPLPLGEWRRPAARVLRRLTRKVLGATVGLALGGGAAFGIAHVGVLLALEEAGLPVDLIAGTSMGSIVALAYAAGLSPTRMLEIAGRIGNVRTTVSVLDPSVTGAGLLNGKRLVAIFAPLLPRQDFTELDLPCRVVAMDVETGARVDIGTGRLDTAFRASCSIPVVFTPVRVGAQTLVDGGMLDPVPGDVVRDMGADLVVAVNVVPRLERGVTTALSRTFKRASRLNPFSYLTGARDLPDVVDVFMNSLQAIQYELGTFKSLSADVLVNVDMAEFTWIDFHRALDIIERGRQAGQRAVPQIRALLDQRLAAG